MPASAGEPAFRVTIHGPQAAHLFTCSLACTVEALRRRTLVGNGCFVRFAPAPDILSEPSPVKSRVATRHDGRVGPGSRVGGVILARQVRPAAGVRVMRCAAGTCNP
jgi:hypothetical protein